MRNCTLKSKATFGSLIALVAFGLVGTSVAQADIVWLLQTGNSNPNGNGAFQNGSQAGGGGAILPFSLTNNTPNVLQLSHGSMGVSTITSLGLKTSDMYASAWTPAGFWGGNPLSPGDLVGHSSVPMPTITTVGSGNIFGEEITNYMASWDTGSLLGLNFILQPGQTAYFTIAVPNQGQGGAWFARESTMVSLSDTLWVSGGIGYQPFANIEYTQFDGRLEGNWAFQVVPEPGDVNCDGSISTLDVEPFVVALLDPAGYAAAFPNCNVQTADMNGDGTINGLDISGFVKCVLGGPCS